MNAEEVRKFLETSRGPKRRGRLIGSVARWSELRLPIRGGWARSNFSENLAAAILAYRCGGARHPAPKDRDGLV